MHTLILAGGDAPTRAELDAAWPDWDDGVRFVIAADGGARHAAGLGVRIDRWVGDGDSVGETMLAALLTAGVAIERAPTDKDESDTELAVMAALAAGADRLSIVGALGGPRLDHALANLALLTLPELAGLDVRLLAAAGRLRLLASGPPDPTAMTATTARSNAARPDAAATDRAPVGVELTGRIGDLVSLLPLGGDVTGVTTTGLRYPLHDEPLRIGRTRGLSNVREATTAGVMVRTGRLLVVEAPATL